MRIEVTQEDIENGQRGSGDRCPIARAVLRNLRVIPAGLYVGSQAIETDEEWIDLPREARAFIRAFDSLGSNQPLPFAFDLPIDHLMQAAS